MKKYSKKIMLGAFAFFALAIVILVFVFAFANRTQYYECTEYKFEVFETIDENGKKVYKTDNHLTEYAYYRIYLNKGESTFKLVLKYADQKEEKVYLGFYSIDEKTDILELDYKDGYAMEPEKIYYRMSGDKLTRVEIDVTNPNEWKTGDYQVSPARATIYQKFEKKISW